MVHVLKNFIVGTDVLKNPIFMIKKRDRIVRAIPSTAIIAAPFLTIINIKDSSSIILSSNSVFD